METHPSWFCLELDWDMLEIDIVDGELIYM